MSLLEPSSLAVGRLRSHLRAWLSPRTNHMIVALASDRCPGFRRHASASSRGADMVRRPATWLDANILLDDGERNQGSGWNTQRLLHPGSAGRHLASIDSRGPDADIFNNWV
jgi:hypothetical protein